MKNILILTAIVALPTLTLAQAPDQPNDKAKGEANEQQQNAPAKKKKAHATMEREKGPMKSDATMEHGMKNESHASREKGAMKSETRMGAGQTQASSSKTTKKVNKEEFKTSHREVFALGKHPKDFFIKRYGANHFRLIGNSYFVFVDGCWVAVDVDGFTFVQRVICEGDPDFVVIY